MLARCRFIVLSPDLIERLLKILLPHHSAAVKPAGPGRTGRRRGASQGAPGTLTGGSATWSKGDVMRMNRAQDLSLRHP